MTSCLKKKILVLGVGGAQADFIEHCKKRGFEVHSCSYKNRGRGRDISHYFSVIDIKNLRELNSYVKKKNIDIIYSIGSDVALPAIMTISKTHNLPFFTSPATVAVCNNKFKLRNALKSIREYSIEAAEVRNERDLERWTIFPAVIKPVDNQGQRGVREVYSQEKLNDAFYAALCNSPSQTAIIEEYVDGFEISVNLYVVDGVIAFQFITERISFKEFPGGIIKKHIYPVTQKIDKHKITVMSEAVIRTLGIHNGPAYLQVKIGRNVDPKIIEVAPRLDGCHIWRLINTVTGINLFDIVLNHLLDGKIDPAIFKRHRPADVCISELTFFTSSPHRTFHIKDYSAVNDAVHTEWYYREGETVKPINGFAEKVGYQILTQK